MSNREIGLFSKKPHPSEYEDRDKSKHCLIGYNGRDNMRMECPKGFTLYNGFFIYQKDKVDAIMIKYCPACGEILILNETLLDYSYFCRFRFRRLTMSDRTVPFDKDAICDECERKGALDFMGNMLCPECAEKAIGKPEPCNRCGCNPCECGE